MTNSKVLKKNVRLTVRGYAAFGTNVSFGRTGLEPDCLPTESKGAGGQSRKSNDHLVTLSLKGDLTPYEGRSGVNRRMRSVGENNEENQHRPDRSVIPTSIKHLGSQTPQDHRYLPSQ